MHVSYPYMLDLEEGLFCVPETAAAGGPAETRPIKQGSAEDAASEVFVGVVRGLARFRGGERDFRAWVFSIAHRRMMDERRRRARRREQPLDPSDLAEATDLHPRGDAEAEALDRAGRDWALGALASLTEDQRAVLLLRVLADLPVADVARILGRSVGAVKALQGRALAALARRIEREGVT